MRALHESPIPWLWSLALLLPLLLARPATALTLTATSQGWWQCCALRHFGAGNYVAGGVSPGVESRDYFVFDLTDVAGPITGATLSLFNPASDGVFTFDGFYSPDATETYTLFDVILVTEAITTNLGGYNAFLDLGTGFELGSVVVTAADNGSYVDIPLNEAALALLNNRIGSEIVFGGAITTLDPLEFGRPLTTQYVFGFSGSQRGLLDLNVPEPRSLPLVLAGIGLFASKRARRDRRSSRRPAPVDQPSRALRRDQKGYSIT